MLFTRTCLAKPPRTMSCCEGPSQGTVQGDLVMGAVDHQVAIPAADGIHPAWELLDEASQVLVRAESLVLLLSFARDVEEHHAYGASMASDLLKTLKEKLSAAQEKLRPRAVSQRRPAKP